MEGGSMKKPQWSSLNNTHARGRGRELGKIECGLKRAKKHSYFNEREEERESLLSGTGNNKTFDFAFPFSLFPIAFLFFTFHRMRLFNLFSVYLFVYLYYFYLV